MNTPICDFVKKYAASDTARFHMPGHKGRALLGPEPYDITEISGADVLYSADGIIDESENNASTLFGTAHTYYSTEGSTLAIKAMLAIAVNARKGDTPPVVLAARNVHRAFISAAALIDFSVEWMYPEQHEHLCSCTVSAERVDAAIEEMIIKPCAVYITSPDYLGNIADVEGIAKVCDKYGIPLLVDNAHGAYLAFLEPSRHPIALGAAMCADSAHKTLPTLTGGAYLHISRKFSDYTRSARSTLSLFASTSPSYLILQSLDLCNRYLADGFRERLADTVIKINSMKTRLESLGILFYPSEPMKIVLDSARFGYTGTYIADFLRSFGIESEFSDTDFTVLMSTTENIDADYARLESALASLQPRTPITREPRALFPSKQVISIREAAFSQYECIPISDAVGRICAVPTVSCPPAIPIVVSGERIDERTVRLFELYGIDEIEVILQ